jgi:hypothetical protein
VANSLRERERLRRKDEKAEGTEEQTLTFTNDNGVVGTSDGDDGEVDDAGDGGTEGLRPGHTCGTARTGLHKVAHIAHMCVYMELFQHTQSFPWLSQHKEERGWK